MQRLPQLPANNFTGTSTQPGIQPNRALAGSEAAMKNDKYALMDMTYRVLAFLAVLLVVKNIWEAL